MPRLKPTRLLAIGGIVLVAFLYWKPTRTYMHTKAEVQARKTVRDGGDQRNVVLNDHQGGAD